MSLLEMRASTEQWQKHLLFVAPPKGGTEKRAEEAALRTKCEMKLAPLCPPLDRGWTVSFVSVTQNGNRLMILVLGILNRNRMNLFVSIGYCCGDVSIRKGLTDN